MVKQLPCEHLRSGLVCKYLMPQQAGELTDIPAKCSACGWNPQEAKRRGRQIEMNWASGQRPLKLIVRKGARNGTDDIQPHSVAAPAEN